ncbi:MAG TPA: hypothetical protein P5244_05050, partial [Syntrophales bacterium]|nr:hypothetical protein [Syntrophales bacterium]
YWLAAFRKGYRSIDLDPLLRPRLYCTELSTEGFLPLRLCVAFIPSEKKESCLLLNFLADWLLSYE